MRVRLDAEWIVVGTLFVIALVSWCASAIVSYSF